MLTIENFPEAIQISEDINVFMNLEDALGQLQIQHCYRQENLSRKQFEIAREKFENIGYEVTGGKYSVCDCKYSVCGCKREFSGIIIIRGIPRT